MGRSYAHELSLLSEIYELVSQSRLESVRDLLSGCLKGPAVFVASGGALPVAQFAADLHADATGTSSSAVTPLEFLAKAKLYREAVVLVSASGKHPDAILTASAAKAAGHSLVGLLTCSADARLPKQIRPLLTKVGRVPSVGGKEAFLATTSVLGMATALALAYGSKDPRPEKLSFLSRPAEETLRHRTLVLWSPPLLPVAMDLETRLHEIGLSAVQVSDYRNFAHGRHSGFARHLDEYSVVCLVGEQFRPLAERTAQQLPSSAHVIHLASDEPWPWVVLDLLAASMQVVGTTAAERRIDPGRPAVAEYGRRLYRMSTKRLVKAAGPDPVERKLERLGAFGRQESTVVLYRSHLEHWLDRVTRSAIGGIVLDYDGTCCTVEGRFDPPQDEVRIALKRVLELGVLLGFASGRGRSLYRDLRRWVPREYWPSLVVGLYNGSVIIRLSEELADMSACSGVLAEAAKRLKESHFGGVLEVEARSTHEPPRVLRRLN